MQDQFHTGAKLAALGLSFLAVITMPDLWQLGLIVILLLLLARLASVFVPIIKRVLPFLYLVLMMLLIHGLVNPQNQTYIGYLGLEGLKYGSSVGLRLIAIVILANLLLLTTSSYELIRHTGRLHPDLGMMLGLLLSILPVMRQQMQTTLEVQSARGLKQNGSLGGRLFAYLAVIAPVIIQSINRSHYMAQLLYLRGYTSQKVTVSEPWNRFDWFLVSVALFFLGMVIYLRFVMPFL